MIWKDVNYNLAIDEWGQLLDNNHLAGDQATIARGCLCGLKAEKDVAYYLSVHFGEHPELMVFNNLKIEHRGLTAQIDHLVLSRWSAYFIETKSAGDKISINGDGQWARVYGRKYVNMESPVEQSKRHELLLFDFMESRMGEFMGTILGLEKTFRKMIDVQHIVGVTIKTNIQGRGKDYVDAEVLPLDQIPDFILHNHKEVRSSFVGSALAELRDRKTRRHPAGFTEDEFRGCCGLLMESDIGQTPLEQVHAYIERLPQEAAQLHDSCHPQVGDAPERAHSLGGATRIAPKAGRLKDEAPTTPPPLPVKATTPPPKKVSPEVQSKDASPGQTLVCPRCGGPMALKTAGRGEHAGRQFFGCTRYPKCRMIVNLPPK